MSAQTDRLRSRSPRLSGDLFTASRIRILNTLRPTPQSVSEIVAATGLSQPNVSQHLANLLAHGLVTREARGRSAYYALADERVREILDLMESLSVDGSAGS